MNTDSLKEVIVIGGSAGSLQIITTLVSELPAYFPFALVIVVHRQRNVSSDLVQILKPQDKNIRVLEPDDKEQICGNTVYIAPQNYHLLAEGETFSLDYSEPVMYSRPSIDVCFESFALTFKKRVTGIILSGANSDGTNGLKTIVHYGGIAIAQKPDTAAYPIMPRAAMEAVKPIIALTPQEIVSFIVNKS